MKKIMETFYPETQQDWRKWLEKNHVIQDAVWLMCYKKKSGKPTISWSDAVDEALCFGWIDSKRVTIDEHAFKQYYCKRKPNSTWSKVNKEKVRNLIAQNRMTPAGLACIEVAKKNGSWTILDTVEELIMPDELEKALKKFPKAKAYFLSLGKSNKKQLLYRIALAKTDTTKHKRIEEFIQNASVSPLPKPFEPTKKNI